MTSGQTDGKRAACVLVVHLDGRVLAVSRGVGGALWGMPGGHVETGESFEQAAARELHEETGLVLTEPREVFRAVSAGGHLTATFIGHATGELRPSTEGDVAWIDRSVLTSETTSPFAKYAAELFDHMSGTAMTLDLGIDDVHIDSASSATSKKKTMASISTKTRNAMPVGKFADPAKRRYPIENKAHADNAAARLEQNKANEPDYAAIKRRIVAAQKRFSETKSAKQMRTRGGFRLSIDHPKSGRIEVRHMSDTQCPGVEIENVALSDSAASKQVWIQIARPGRYFKDGFFTLDPKVFSDIVRNFDATENHQIPVDFEHATEQSASSGSIPILGAPAQGWIKAVEARADGNLYGLVEWGDLARDYIKQGNYKYISPAIRFGAKDPRTAQDIGAKLTSAALTNKPFLDGMRAVAASDAVGNEPAQVQLSFGGAGCYSTSEYMPQVRACLKMGDLSTAKDCKDQLDKIREHLTAAGGDHTASPQGVPLSQYLMPMRSMVNAPMGSNWEDVFDVMDDLIDAAIDEHEIAYHGGTDPDEDDEPADEASASDDDGDASTMSNGVANAALHEEDINMSDAKELTVQLTDAKAEVITLTEKVAKAETEVAGLTLKLKDAESKTAEQATRNAALETEIKTLRDDAKKREDQAMSEKVETAFVTYKDAKQLTDADKRAMLLTLKSDPALFDELYPAIDPSKRHLLRDIVAGTRPGVGSVSQTANEIPSMKTLTDRFVKEGKSIEEASALAYTETMRLLHGGTSTTAA